MSGYNDQIQHQGSYIINQALVLYGAPMCVPDSEGAKWWYCSQY